MKIREIRCKSCVPSVIIFSRCRHDFRWCPDKHVAVDGGQELYFKVCQNEGCDCVPIELDLEFTIKELYDDWNKGTDKLGLIVENENSEKTKDKKILDYKPKNKKKRKRENL